MNYSCAINSLGSMPKLQMEVDQHLDCENGEPLKSHPTVIGVIDSIILMKKDTTESSIIITLEEPKEEDHNSNQNIFHNLACCNPNLQNSIKLDTDHPCSSIVPTINRGNGRYVAPAQKCISSIVASTSLGSESDSDTASNSSRTTLDSTASTTYHACTVPGCDKKFSRPSRLLQHSRIHTGERPYVCPVVDCGRSYTRSQHLHRHTQITHKAPAAGQCQQQAPGDNKCSKCGKQFASIYSLRKHMSQYHERRKYCCNECNQVFFKQQHLRTHSQMHSNEPAFKCDIPGCTASFFLPSKLQRHKLQHVPGRYKCTRDPTCKQTFDRHVDLRRHLAAQHPFVCSLCGVEFAEQSRYNRHRATHEDLRLTYHCTKQGCGRCYYTLRALTSHVRNSHEQKSPQHECVVCTKRFATKQKLQQHLKTHGPDYGRVVKKVAGKTRRTRCDKGFGRTDYRSLLAGLNSAKHPAESLGGQKNVEAIELAKKFNPSIERPSLVGDERARGTQRLLQGSAVARQEINKASGDIISNLINHDCNVQNLDKLNITRETFTRKSVVELRDSGISNPQGLHEVRNLLNDSNIHLETKPKDDISVCFERDKIGSVFISGQGAIKESHVLLARLSDRMVEMFDGCKLAGSGK